MAFSGSEVSVLGPSGVSHPPWASFAGKSAGFTWTSVGALFLFTTANWSSGISIRLESTFRATSSEVKVRLYDESAASAVSSSELTTSGTTLARRRTSALTLVDGNEYRVQVGVQGSAGAIVGASLVGLPPS